MGAAKSGDTPEGWAEILKESDADLASGRVVPLSRIRAEIRATIEEIEAELTGGLAVPRGER